MRRRTHGKKGNTKTRMYGNNGNLTGYELPYHIRNDSTKFFKRPERMRNKAVFRKYPTPFLYKNPYPEGEFVFSKKFWDLGTGEAHRKELEATS